MLNTECVDVEGDNVSIQFTDDNVDEALTLKLKKIDARRMAIMIIDKTRWKNKRK